jgi:hypothetical protein
MSAWAQDGRIVISPIVGYRTSGDFGVRPSTDVAALVSGIKVPDGLAYGVALGYRFSQYMTAEVEWIRSGGMAQAIPWQLGAPNVDIFNTWQDVIHANFLFYFGNNPAFQPFFITGLGVTLFDARAEGFGSASRFSWSLGGGFEKMFNDKIGFRATAKWFTTYINDSVGWWYDWWWGGYALVPVSQYMGQWQFTGGLVFRF